jgi:hypothetical protein
MSVRLIGREIVFAFLATGLLLAQQAETPLPGDPGSTRGQADFRSLAELSNGRWFRSVHADHHETKIHDRDKGHS